MLSILFQLLAVVAKATDTNYRRAGTDRTAAEEIMTMARMSRLLTLVRVLWLFETFRDWLSVLPRARYAPCERDMHAIRAL